DDLARRLSAAQQHQRQPPGGTLGRLALRLAAADPHQVLARGYAWLADTAGTPVIRAAGLRPGAALTAQWADGRAAVQVLSTTLGLVGPPPAAAGDPTPPMPAGDPRPPARAPRRRAKP
ncbi:MAG: hypothetical protein H7242_11040, partial [Microbacteriaceae bacterium]|nr:hypothetical protein [Burkholderiaceae bacterium]